MNQTDTHNRLLDAAEHLFAEHGIAATSLRAITSEAPANLASIHYHFGSREALVEAVFARRLEPLNRERCRLLDLEEAAADGPPPVEAIVNAFVAPAMRLAYDPDGGGEHFMCLMGRLYRNPETWRTKSSSNSRRSSFDSPRRCPAVCPICPGPICCGGSFSWSAA